MLKHGSRTLALLVLAATQLMVILDGTIVTVALPAIRSDLGFTDASLSWVVNAFFIPFALALLPAGRLGDVVGNRTVFVGGLAVFTVASAVCAIAWDPSSLIVGRAVQGIGGGAATAVVLAMISGLYDDAGRRMKAFAVLAFVGSAGGSLGMVGGGVLTELASWRWAFGINVPIGLPILALAMWIFAPLPASGPTTGGLVPRALFADRRFALACGVLFTILMAGMSFQFLSSLYLQDTLGHGPMATGVAFLTVSLAIAVASLGFSGRLAERFGSTRVLIAGLALFIAGMLLMARMPDSGGYLVDVAPGFLIMGIGFGLAMPQATELAMAAAPPAYAGIASGFANATQQVGGAIGLFAIAAAAAGAGRSVGYLLAAGALAVGLGLATMLRSPAVPRPETPPVPELPVAA